MARTRVKFADPKPALDLDGLARRVGQGGMVLVKDGLAFDHPIEVRSIAVVLAGPDGARSIILQSYGGFVGKAAARLENLETAGAPIAGEIGDYLAKLQRRGYRIVQAADAAQPAAKKPRRSRKAEETADAASAAGVKRSVRRKAE